MCISSLETILFRIFCVHTTRMTLFINTLQISRYQCQKLISFIVLKIVVPRLLKIRIRNERHCSCNFFRIFFLSTILRFLTWYSRIFPLPNFSAIFLPVNFWIIINLGSYLRYRKLRIWSHWLNKPLIENLCNELTFHDA